MFDLRILFEPEKRGSVASLGKMEILGEEKHKPSVSKS